jgi:2-enoate reductase
LGVAYPKLFEPIKIGKVTIRNRIAMAPMGLFGLTNTEGNPTQEAIDYYVERAKGGTGLIITGLFKVENTVEGLGGARQRLWGRSRIPFTDLCRAVHAHGAKIFIQLTAGFGRVIPMAGPGFQPVSASAITHYGNPSIVCRAITTEEADSIVAAFGPAAELVAAAGADGVELHGHEGYLFDQFTTAIWNQRTDKYGGDLKGRLTFPIEILKTIKKYAGDDFLVQYRFGLKHYIKGFHSGALPGEEYVEAGRDIEEGLEMAKILEEAGFDSLHVDAGCYDSWYWAHPPTYQEHGHMVDMAAKAKQVVKIPVMAVGRLEVPELAEEIIKTGQADMIASGRGLLCDPYWPLKAAEGRPEDIRPCLGCHDACFGGIGRITCALNPQCSRETLYRLHMADEKKKVLVVGGGAAGMEAARVAATRGHNVVLYEKEDSLGGHLIEASIPDFKKDLQKLLEWFEVQLNKLGVEIKLGTEASQDIIDKENPDVAIIATGSKALIPDIPGIDKDNVSTCIDVLLGRKEVGENVVVVGGGLVGCETAVWLAQQGKNVTIVEMLPELLDGTPRVPRMNRTMLLDMVAYNKINVITGACMNEVTDEGIIVSGGKFDRKLIEADDVVLALGLQAEDSLYNALIGKIAQLYALGDCREPRNIMGAVWDSYELARTI